MLSRTCTSGFASLVRRVSLTRREGLGSAGVVPTPAPDVELLSHPPEAATDEAVLVGVSERSPLASATAGMTCICLFVGGFHGKQDVQ